MTAKKPAPRPQHDALTECVQFVEQYLKSKDTSELPALKTQIAAVIPEARKLCLEVGEEHLVTAAFRELEAGLSRKDDTDRVTRHRNLHEPHGRIACWSDFRRRLLYLRALKQSTGDPIAAFVRFANETLHLADDACQWFPEREPTREELEGAGWFCCPKERGLLCNEIAPRYIPDIRATLLNRAIEEVRTRGEAPWGSIKLERIEKSLRNLVRPLQGVSGKSIFGSAVAMQLADAIADALVLVSSKSRVSNHHERPADIQSLITELSSIRATMASQSTNQTIIQVVNGGQAAAQAGMSKKSFDYHVGRGNLPRPDYPGGAGHAHKWNWSSLREPLEKLARHPLPERFPSDRFV